ncbi:MAG: nicotianamine synthase family protein [Nocardioides sp.]
MLIATDSGGLAPGPTPAGDRIVGIYTKLAAVSSLAPSVLVDGLFGSLVQTCLTTSGPEHARALADPRLDRLRPDLVRICAEGEGLLEDVWARRTLQADDPSAAVTRFPYFGNYQDLTRLEVHALAGVGHPMPGIRHVCFVGGGALPLSAILMHQALGSPVTVIDRDEKAVELARALVRRVRPGAPIHVRHADATSPEAVAEVASGCDLVVVAALVGLDRTQKQASLRAIARALAPGTIVVMRSANGLRSLLYPVVDLDDVEAAGLGLQVLLHPFHGVINSVLVARRG